MVVCVCVCVHAHVRACVSWYLILIVPIAQVERSKALLSSLGDERERWDAGSEAFKTQMSTITGDVLLTSAFMAYGGNCRNQ